MTIDFEPPRNHVRGTKIALAGTRKNNQRVWADADPNQLIRSSFHTR